MRYDDILENLDENSQVPEDISDSESDEEDEVVNGNDEEFNDNANYGLGIGDGLVLETEAEQSRDPESFEFVFQDLTFLAEVTKLMKKVRSHIDCQKFDKYLALHKTKAKTS